MVRWTQWTFHMLHSLFVSRISPSAICNELCCFLFHSEIDLPHDVLMPHAGMSKNGSDLHGNFLLEKDINSRGRKHTWDVLISTLVSDFGIFMSFPVEIDFKIFQDEQFWGSVGISFELRLNHATTWSWGQIGPVQCKRWWWCLLSHPQLHIAWCHLVWPTSGCIQLRPGVKRSVFFWSSRLFLIVCEHKNKQAHNVSLWFICQKRI